MAFTAELYEVHLGCKHQYLKRYKPPGTELVCPKCWKETQVLECAARYGWRCDTCGRVKTYLSRKLEGERRAMEHARNFKGHLVTYYNADGHVLWDNRIALRQVELDLGDS